ncbi:MAG: ATP-binding cassette domain-containing protein [Clostridiales bacterium]|uniref:ATP-binding cassette domain-containing protein n=1 Tax=Clostridium sp. N3C TaxID=1776758 RepID=UPI00092E093E|nr:ATP-binding cassette domain-containing protein [Clostridium sp. N3C]NLZ49946.1 ATP-binding cassette domain-containing protein [Clostridiales bacterium]SCN22689.1 Xylose import ATP-binding protein XylG [Clostridium sp. N3C]
MNEYILEMRNITKTFPGVKALDSVNLKVKRGEIHCLIGENGSGKSTLMKILSGVYPYGEYSGDIIYDGEIQKFSRISDSEKVGIAIIYQELALVPEMTIYENIYLGHEIKKGKTIDWNETIVQAEKMLKRVGLDINPSIKVKDLGVGKQQLVEIAKALSKNVKLLILDEPTAALNEIESENLLKLITELKKEGVTSILISHKLKEVTAVADSITVLRDGKFISAMDAKEGTISESTIIKHMVGREIEDIYPKRPNKKFGEVFFEAVNWSAYDYNLGRQVLKNVNFKVRKGEIVGIAGLMGAGRTELALSIFGNSKDYKVEGDLYVEGKKVNLKSVKDAIEAGIAYVTEDRKGNGLILIDDIKSNISLANLKAISKNGVINSHEEINIANDYKKSLNIKAPSIEQKVGNLSGGNQQKVSLAKWMFAKPNLLILDEPTRGIDVGAKFEIYTLMNKLVAQGMSIIMISSELPEVLGMSDRIYVMADGKLVGELSQEEATQENIMELATN